MVAVGIEIRSPMSSVHDEATTSPADSTIQNP